MPVIPKNKKQTALRFALVLVQQQNTVFLWKFLLEACILLRNQYNAIEENTRQMHPDTQTVFFPDWL